MEEGRSGSGRRSVAPPAQPEGFGMFVLRLWMWAVPVLLFTASIVFAGVAIAESKWGLFVMMLFIGGIAVSLFVFHWWLLYRFGRSSGGE